MCAAELCTNPDEIHIGSDLDGEEGGESSQKAVTNCTEPGTGLGTEPETGLEADPGTGLGTEPETGLGADPGTGLGTEPGTGLGTELGDGMAIISDTGPRPESEMEPKTEPETEPGTGVGIRSDTDPGTGVGIRSDTDPGTGPRSEGVCCHDSTTSDVVRGDDGKSDDEKGTPAVVVSDTCTKVQSPQ